MRMEIVGSEIDGKFEELSKWEKGLMWSVTTGGH
jgi:hypothetical protein